MKSILLFVTFLTRIMSILLRQPSGFAARGRGSAWNGIGQVTPSRGPRGFRLEKPSSQVLQEESSSESTQMKHADDAICSAKTTVVNVRKAELQKIGYKSLEDWVQDPSHVYIGRDMTHYVPGAVGSKWGNPFKSRKLGNKESCQMYRNYILNDTRIQSNGKTLLQSLDELKGKELGCWCHPEQCHGHELVQLINEYCK